MVSDQKIPAHDVILAEVRRESVQLRRRVREDTGEK